MSHAPFKVGSDRQLGTTPEQEGRQYLLFAGTQQPPNGGLGDLVDTFMSEEAARRAFREIRLRTSSTSNWAQLAVVDREQGVKPLCWFGIGAEPDRYRPAHYWPAPAPAGEARTIPLRRPYVSNWVALVVTALVAVATTMIAVLVDDDTTPPPASRPPAVSVTAQESS